MIGPIPGRIITVVTAIAGLFAMAGCTASGGSGGSGDDRPFPNPSNPDHAHLVATARLEPCPASSGPAADGGLPDLTLKCLGTGPAVHLAALRGTPTLVNIWGSWCGPCQAETPFLQRAHTRLGAAVRFLGVDTEDSPDSALDFAAHVRLAMRYPSVVDDDKAVLLGVHGPSAVPMTLLVDANGRVVHPAIESYDSVDAGLSEGGRSRGVRVCRPPRGSTRCSRRCATPPLRRCSHRSAPARACAGPPSWCSSA